MAESQRGQNETRFLQKTFSQYYGAHCPLPSDVSSREFGFGVHKKIDFRHKAFASGHALQAYLVREAPLYASYSIAHYKFPDGRPMEKKEATGFDLVFDLDATPEGHEHNKALCQTCIENTKQDALRLLEEFLLADFGFAKSEVEANFSGSKGFHFHAETSAVQELSQNQRAQLVDYASATGFDAQRVLSVREHFTKNAAQAEIRKKQVLGPSPNALGWHKRIFQGVTRELMLPKEALLKSLKAAGYTAKEAEFICESRGEILRKMQTPLAGSPFSVWDSFPHPENLFEKIAQKQSVSQSVATDKTVTYDLRRLIRLPDSLHGDTALMAKKTQDLASFDAQRDAIAFSTKERAGIVPSSTGSVLLAGETHEYSEGKKLDAPLPLALLLLCKGLATLPPANQ